MEKHTLKDGKLKLEDSYGVRISDAAFDLAVQGLKTCDSKLIFDDASPEKAMEILDGACKLVFERFRNCAYETFFYEEAHQLRWDLVELIELYNNRPNSKPGLWVTLLRWTRDCKSIFMDEFLSRWETVVGSPGGCHFLNQEFVQQLSLFKEINNKINDNNNVDDDASSQKSCLDDVAQFINVIRAKLVSSFGPLLTVTSTHVAEVASKMSDVPLTQILLPHNDYKKVKAKHMTDFRVLEQEDVVHDIYETLASSTRLSSSSGSTQPRGSFLLLGQSGAGKTEIAKAVAKHWYCDVSRLVEIDVSDLADESDLWRRLSEVVEKRPYSVIVLDKIDKASESVMRALVDISSKEVQTDVDLSDSIIFMTSDVGSDQLALVCRCHKEDEDTFKLFLLNPVKFRETHDCTLKGSGPERALIQVRKFFSAALLDSVDKVLFVERFHCYKDVFRVLLREIVRELYGQRLVVHVSDGALFFLLRDFLPRLREEGGKVLKRALLEQVIQRLPASQNLNNDVVYVDKHAGTTKVSFSFHRHEQSVDDWYFKLKDGTFDRLMVNLRTKVESTCRIFELRNEYIGLLDSNDIGSSKVLADNIFDEMLKWSPFQETPKDIYRDITENESCVPSSWEREFKDWKKKAEEFKRRTRAQKRQIMFELASTTKEERRRRVQDEEQRLMDKIEQKRRLRAEEQLKIAADNEAEKKIAGAESNEKKIEG
ncbi:hypothetical protein CASFOL_014959 [Castilleja foliolosa]|uniref:AAA+ ATPase domain-containing protein n=1 Tax=Castilleja foliolosa TaxID=1961234 RepID=A0ABD3DEE5_9LAMI